MVRCPRTRRWTASTEAAALPAEAASRVDFAAAVANWIEENLSVATKDRRTERLRLNSAQSLLLNYVAWCWAQRLAVRILVPKARQQGVSTFWQALGFALAVLHDRKGKAFRVVTIAHIEESADLIFAMSRRFERRLPREWSQPLYSKQRGLLEWRHGSRTWVLSAQLGDAAGKGPTIDMVHGSEVANWADRGANPADLWSSVSEAVPGGCDSIVVFESTAKGRDPFFHRKIVDSLEGRGDFSVVFLPWFLTPEYSMTWADYCATRRLRGWDLPSTFTPTVAEEELRERLAMTIVRPGEEWTRYRVSLTDEQLIWRRAKIESLEGALERFQRYYPSTIEEAFSSTESTLFPPATLDRLYERVRQPRRGDVRLGGEGVAFVESPHGSLSLWAEPVPGREYVIGADVAEGLAAGDFSVASVVDKDAREVAAAWHGKIDPDEFVHVLRLLGRYFNQALLAVENNHNPAVATTLRKSGYPNLYYYRDPDVLRSTASRAGWNTNKRSRLAMLTVLAALLRDDELAVWCRGFADEASAFVRDGKGVYRAAPGKFDDRVMSLAIAAYVCGWRKDDGRRPSAAVRAEVDTPCAAVLAWESEQRWWHREQRRRRREGDGQGLYI